MDPAQFRQAVPPVAAEQFRDRMTPRDEQHGHERRCRHPARAIPARMVKAHDERQQVERQRENPQPRLGRNVMTRMIRRCNEEHRGERGQQHPACPLAPARSPHRLLPDGARCGGGADPTNAGRSRHRFHLYHRNQRAGRGKQPEPPGPARADRGQIKPGFEEIRKRQERKQRPHIRQCIQPVHRAAGPATGEPMLKQRSGAGKTEIRQPHRGRQNPDDFPDRRLVTARAQRHIGHHPPGKHGCDREK